jgi:hypothetical protein
MRHKHKVKSIAARPTAAKRKRHRVGKVKPEVAVDWKALEASEINQAEVNRITDRIFGSVLARHGWRRDGRGHVEHVGSEHDAAA